MGERKDWCSSTKCQATSLTVFSDLTRSVGCSVILLALTKSMQLIWREEGIKHESNEHPSVCCVSCGPWAPSDSLPSLSWLCEVGASLYPSYMWGNWLCPRPPRWWQGQNRRLVCNHCTHCYCKLLDKAAGLSSQGRHMAPQPHLPSRWRAEKESEIFPATHQ